MTQCTEPPREDGCRYAESAADSAVKKMFAIIGVDVDDPSQVEEFRKDLRFGQSLRHLADKGMLAIVGALFVALGMAAWAGIKKSLGGP